MAIWESRVEMKRTMVYTVPVSPGFGANHSALVQALQAARKRYFELYGSWPADDGIWVKPSDEALRIEFEYPKGD